MSTTQEAMKGKICVVTGATSGIGKAAATALAEQGAIIIVVGRSRTKCEHTVQKINKFAAGGPAEYIPADLSSQKDIHRLADQFLSRYKRLDVLLNNAGAKFVRRRVSVDGYEMTFALNHLAYFTLTLLLLDSLKAAEKARVVNVSSGAHADCLKIDFDDLQSEKSYVGKQAYAQSKLANILFTYELSRRLEGSGISTNALHPGGVATHFCRNNGRVSWLKHVTAHLLARNLVGPAQGAKTSIYLATSPEVEGVSGKYFANQKQLRSAPASYDKESAKRLWDLSLKLSGLNA